MLNLRDYYEVSHMLFNIPDFIVVLIYLYLLCSFLIYFPFGWLETRDASFKPIPVVKKPISSVLEKIRKRKLEISKKWVNHKSSFVFSFTF